MSTDFLVKLVNLYSRNETVIKDFNTDFSIQSSGNFYAANTSYTYQPVPGNVSRPSADEAQKVFRLISKSTGKESASVKQIFKEEGVISGWVTEAVNSQVFLWGGSAGALMVPILSGRRGAAEGSGMAEEWHHQIPVR
ncbi:hypothetical protein ACFSQ7_03805 [Paenibacillus rhizoplanae]